MAARVWIISFVICLAAWPASVDRGRFRVAPKFHLKGLESLFRRKGLRI